MSINLALADCANNCLRDGATAIISLKSGVVLVGQLERVGGTDLGTRHMKTPTGWITFLAEEVAAVEAKRD